MIKKCDISTYRETERIKNPKGKKRNDPEFRKKETEIMRQKRSNHELKMK